MDRVVSSKYIQLQLEMKHAIFTEYKNKIKLI